MKKIVITLSFILATISQSAIAICWFEQGEPAVNHSMVLQVGNITVAKDLPLGGEVYRQRLTSNTSAVLICNPNPIFRITSVLPTTPMRLANWGTGVYAGKVYETGVEGLGVVIVFNDQGTDRVIPIIPSINTCRTLPGRCEFRLNSRDNYEVRLIKIANTVGSGTISGNNLPTAELGLTNDAVNYVFSRISFSGNINVVSRTCQTPDVEVDLGAHKVSEFTQTGSATPWKDFFITLDNCPAFHGFYPGALGRPASNQGNVAVNTVGARQSNLISVSLASTVPAINADQGILALNATGAGAAGSATGVGVQIANGAGVPVRLNQWIASGINPQPVDGMSYSIPLKARYLRTPGPVGAGRAHATAQFTINYQ